MTLAEAPAKSGDAAVDTSTAPGFATVAEEASPTASTSSEVTPQRDVEGVEEAPDEPVPQILDGFQVLAKNGHAKADVRGERLEAGQAPVIFDTADSPARFECGSIMVRNGSCYKCINCGSTSGCS
jgi:ribonucleoside-diphosphate reductase alpha chain